MVRIRFILRLLAAVAMAAWPIASGGCASVSRQERFEFTRLCMGVQTRIITHAATREAAREGAERAFARIAALEQAMSDYRPRSELSLLCARARAGDHAWQEVSFDLFRALALSQTLAAKTDGAFSATIGPAVRQWREARRTGALPDEAVRAEAVRLSDWRLLEIDRESRRVRLHEPGVGLDLGGIGKGYAAQAALDELAAIGLPRSLVALGGDIAVGLPPWRGEKGEEGWRIALRPGLAELLVANCAVSTSGDDEQFIEIGGRRYSHIVDPRTGLGVVGGPWVTVIASRGEYADALATAASVLGVDDAETLLLDAGAAAVFVEHADGGRSTTTVIDPRGLLRWHAPARAGTVSPPHQRMP
ncbi:MAG: FAD:protein FMN transferase [Phycisphaeraceae bacterium]|nr:FAD:protein FMN transferase [Phycisphaeraceae bacterium]